MNSHRRANHVRGVEVDSVLYEEWGFEFPHEFKFDSYNGEMGIWILRFHWKHQEMSIELQGLGIPS